MKVLVIVNIQPEALPYVVHFHPLPHWDAF